MQEINRNTGYSFNWAIKYGLIVTIAPADLRLGDT